MLLRCLGDLTIDGASFARPKPLSLVAYLSLNGRRSRRDVARLFWPDAADPRNRLSVVLHRVERELPGVLVADGETVEARLGTDVHAVRDALRRGDLGAARAHYRGAFLAGTDVASVSSELEEWIRQTAEDVADELRAALLSEAWRVGTERRFEAAAELVDAALAVEGAPPLEPADLARAHAIALAGGSPMAGRLAREATELQLALARRPSEARAQLMTDGGPGNLPRRVTSFVGRARERVELAPHVGEDGRPIVTLLGPGGIGKTRLALALARDRRAEGAFPGGVWFVPLATVERCGDVGGAIAEALGIVAGRAEMPFEAVARAVGSQRTLLVLDNMDRLSEAGEDLAALVAACPQLFVLTTSRARLELEEESVVPVGGLPVPDEDTPPHEAVEVEAVRLFLDRARRARLNFAPSDAEVRASVELCRGLGGAPLAIELAAVAVRDRSPTKIATELAAGRGDLASPSRTLPARHRSLRASFEYSWELLTEDERTALARVSVFRGGFDAADAAAVAGATAEVLARLADRSLLERDEDGRYGLHPVLATFARERFDLDPDTSGVRARHARHFAAFARRERTRIHGPDFSRAMEAFGRERANLAQAADWGLASDPDLALELAFDRIDAWRHAGRFRDGFEAAEAACAVAGRAGRRARIGGLVAAGSMAYRLGDLATARVRLRAALDEAGQGAAAPGAAALDDDALIDAAAQDDASVDRGAWRVLGDVAFEEGAYDDAAFCFRRALAAARGSGDEIEELASATGVGRTAAVRGDVVTARRELERALSVAERRGSPTSLASAHFNLGSLARDHGDLDEAERHVGLALELDERLSDRWGMATDLRQLAALAYERGEAEASERRYREALALCRTIGDATGAADVHHALGLAAVQRGDLAGGLEHQRAALRIRLEAGQEALAVPLAWALARLADAAGRPCAAARFWGAEAALRTRHGSLLRETERAVHARDEAETRERLGDATFEREAQRGAATSLAELVGAFRLDGDRAAPRRDVRPGGASARPRRRS